MRDVRVTRYVNTVPPMNRSPSSLIFASHKLVSQVGGHDAWGRVETGREPWLTDSSRLFLKETPNHHGTVFRCLGLPLRFIEVRRTSRQGDMWQARPSGTNIQGFPTSSWLSFRDCLFSATPLRVMNRSRPLHEQEQTAGRLVDASK